MNIVFEGADNVGKSTVIQKVAERINWQVVPSEGPERYPGEIDARIMMYRQQYQHAIFDRHPAVSEAMYCFLRDAPGPSPSSLDLFYRDDNIFIYCHPPAGRDPLQDHVFNPEIDTPEHIEAIKDNYALLLHQYSEWALQHAHLLYRIGDDVDRLIFAIEGMLYGT